MAKQKLNKVKELPGGSDNVASFTVELEKASSLPSGDPKRSAWSQDNISEKDVIKYPVSLGALMDAAVMNPYHARCLRFKSTAVIGSGYTLANGSEDKQKLGAVRAVLTDDALSAFGADYYQFGNAYLECETNAKGIVVKLHHVRAASLWKTKTAWVQRVVEDEGLTPGTGKFNQIEKKKILHRALYTPLSDHYGLPEYIAALLPIMLSYEADDFHRKYYSNGANAGFIIKITGLKSISEADRKEIKNQLESTKGPGNFRSLVMAFGGKDVEVEVIGVAKEGTIRDDYTGIKTTSRESILTSHGLPPRLMSIILDSKSGAISGQVDEEMRLFNIAFVEPEQLALESFLNPLLPYPIKFKPFLLSRSDATPEPEPGEADK